MYNRSPTFHKWSNMAWCYKMTKSDHTSTIHNDYTNKCPGMSKNFHYMYPKCYKIQYYHRWPWDYTCYSLYSGQIEHSSHFGRLD